MDFTNINRFYLKLIFSLYTFDAINKYDLLYLYTTVNFYFIHLILTGQIKRST